MISATDALKDQRWILVEIPCF